MVTQKKIKATAEFRFWYPANREPEPETFDEYKALVPRKKNRKRIVPMTSEGHIAMNGKLLCEAKKSEAAKRVGCDGGKTVAHSLSGVGVCKDCLKRYSAMYTSETRKLKIWNDGGFKVF